MKAFVTGANGFIGSHLVTQLAARGDSVVCLVRDPARVAGHLKLPGVEWVKGDVTEPDTMRAAMRGSAVVYHVAGMYKFGPKYTRQMRAINVDGARNVLQMAAELGVPKIIYTGTVGVFGNTRGKIVDESFKCPKEELGSEYERTKWEAHYEVAVPLQAQGAPVIIVQPGVVTGPADPSPHILQVEFYLNRLPIGFGANSGTTWAHVDDIAEGHILAAERGKVGESYILAGPAMTWKQSAEMWATITGIPPPKLWIPGWMVAVNQRLLELSESVGLHLPFSAEGLSSQRDYTYWGSPAKAKRELGWEARPVEQTFSEMLAYEMKKRGMPGAPDFP